MRTPLEKTLRSKLEKTVEKARDIVEVAVTEALTRLGIGEGSAPNYLSEAERKLRTRLRAHGRQLGDVLNRDSTSLTKANSQETELLINEMAYEHWHRMLFARFLEQSDLLMYDQNTHVTLDECFELAEENDPLSDGSEVKDGWDLAGRLAQKMLPQIFRADSPVFDVKLSINHVQALEELIADLHPNTFQASDALGWCYQFWQNKKKKQVNESGVKIGAKELSPVTQLFTEPYMVSFLLDNALGAWWAKRRLTQDDLATATSEQELRERASIPGLPLEYLRFIKDEDSGLWKSAAGNFDKWPDDLSEFKTLDPCCGSGHFLVAKFLMLVPIRIALEGLSAKEAIDKVIAENIHGLELDQRCVELAAFALALEAWRFPNSGGYRQLPELQLACSGVSINEAQKEWKDLAKGDEELENAVKWMQQTFKDAPTLGSLIDPNHMLLKDKQPAWKLLQEATSNRLEVSDELKATAQGLVKAASILSARYEWVVTNVPYLARGKQSEKLKNYCEQFYDSAKTDLATVFLERCNELTKDSCLTSVVMTQNWLFLKSYHSFREELLGNSNFRFVVKLGGGAEAFEDGPGNITSIALVCNQPYKTKQPMQDNYFSGIDVLTETSIEKKKKSLKEVEFNLVSQEKCQRAVEQVITFEKESKHSPLSTIATPFQGLKSGDDSQVRRNFWEFNSIPKTWIKLQSTVSANQLFGGLESVINWKEKGENFARKQGLKAWKKKGIFLSQMGTLPGAIYLGDAFDSNICPIVPHDQKDFSSLVAYCVTGNLAKDIRKIDQKVSIANATTVKAPFEKERWKTFAGIEFSKGIPRPFTNDSTQWIFHGHPCASVVWDEVTKTTAISDLREDDTVLQVAVARLLGYQWPAELDTEMELAPEMREIIAQNKVFDDLVDDDGIVCIPAIRGEKPAVDRLEAILHAAYGDKWSATVLNNLLKTVKSRDLNIWLRDKFFEQHCKLFQHRPFIWHIWDGLPDGFSALINYHQLDYKGLERLIYTYLDDWISTQIQLEKDGDDGAEIRLAAARNLRKQLEDILVGEKGLDIFVRWKSLAEQPIGWNPDLNDGVRLNIRPFMKAKDVGKKDAGILRSKPNIHWKKDRGTDVESAPWYDLGLEYGGNQGDRINDHHLTLAEKKAARENS